MASEASDADALSLRLKPKDLQLELFREMSPYRTSIYPYLYVWVTRITNIFYNCWGMFQKVWKGVWITYWCIPRAKLGLAHAAWAPEGHSMGIRVLQEALSMLFFIICTCPFVIIWFITKKYGKHKTQGFSCGLVEIVLRFLLFRLLHRWFHVLTRISKKSAAH